VIKLFIFSLQTEKEKKTGTW